ncbi:hypothetical protein FJT64_016766 [Amphibalanus amphitrite]|nr:hypothetical protein FJT64_016766 [Amphibalanus amphitrite]
MKRTFYSRCSATPTLPFGPKQSVSSSGSERHDVSPVPGLVRPFRVPGSVGATTALNDSAATYWSLVDLDRATLEPPLTQGMTGDQLEKFLETPLLTGLPCHTQSTERAVKVTTEAAGQVRGARRQDGHALNKLAWRRRNPGQVVKKKYRPVKTTAEKEG